MKHGGRLIGYMASSTTVYCLQSPACLTLSREATLWTLCLSHLPCGGPLPLSQLDLRDLTWEACRTGDYCKWEKTAWLSPKLKKCYKGIFKHVTMSELFNQTKVPRIPRSILSCAIWCILSHWPVTELGPVSWNMSCKFWIVSFYHCYPSVHVTTVKL